MLSGRGVVLLCVVLLVLCVVNNIDGKKSRRSNSHRYKRRAMDREDEGRRYRRQWLNNGKSKCKEVKELDQPKSVELVQGNHVLRHVNLGSIHGEGSPMFKAKKNAGQDQDCSMQFTFRTPVAIKEIELCSFNPKFTGNIGVRSIMVEYNNNGDWMFVRDMAGKKKVFNMRNNHTAIDLPYSRVVRVYPYDWETKSPHIWKPGFRGC